ncbi:MAG: PAS domain S-box protein [bacterium]
MHPVDADRTLVPIEIDSARPVRYRRSVDMCSADDPRSPTGAGLPSDGLAQDEPLRRTHADEFERVFQQAPCPMWISDRETRRFLAVNDATVARYGYERGELLGMPVGVVSDPSMPPEPLTFEPRSAPETPPHHVEVRTHRTKSGARIDVQVLSREITFAGVPALLAIAIDVTDQRRAENALRASELFLRRSQDVGNLGSYNFEVSTGRWSSSTKLDEIFGIDDTFPKDIDGWLTVVHPSQREELRQHLLEHVLGEGHRFDQEYEIVRHSDGQRRWVHGLGELELDGNGRPRAMFGTIQDVTDRRRAEEGLRHAQKLESVGRLAGGIAHDFNNLLTAIGINVELALLDTAADHPVHGRLTEIDKAVQSAANLTRQLLAFSRKQVIHPRVLSLNEVVLRLEKLLRRLLGEDIELRTRLSPALRSVRMDIGQAEQALVNLAVNARDAMPTGGVLTIETANVMLTDDPSAANEEPALRSFVMLALSDTGEGMTESVKSHIFEPFFTTKAHGRGTGLGLAMVYGAVSQHHGRIDVSSELGRGTTFRVYLPSVSEAPETLVACEPASLPRGSETLLLVEDEQQVRERALELLTHLGYRVHAFANGLEALAAIDAIGAPIALLVTDVVMPGMDGRTLANHVQKRRPGIRVLYTSGYTDDVIADLGVLEQGIEFMPKPYRLESLATRIREVLDQRPSTTGAAAP